MTGFRRRTFACAFALFLLAVGCGKSDDSDDGGDRRRADTSSCKLDAGGDTLRAACAPLPDTGPGGDRDGGGGTPKSEYTIMGTCLDKQDTPSGAFHCWEMWIDTRSPSGTEQARSNTKKDCLEESSNNVWKSGEEACPTGSDYIGTCKTSITATYVEEYYYSPDDPAERESGCNMGGGSWDVE